MYPYLYISNSFIYDLSFIFLQFVIISVISVLKEKPKENPL